MGMFVANKVVKLMIKKGLQIKGSKALILGVTFKENCGDIRNSKVVDIYMELKQFGLHVDVYDPYANTHEVAEEYNITPVEKISGKYDVIILAVAHDEFIKLDFAALKVANESVIFDTKAFLNRNIIDARL
jgi:UDP-N-acetyl-D-galactosamine dehydrogenase